MKAYFSLASDEYVPGTVVLIRTIRKFSDKPIVIMSLDLSDESVAVIEKRGVECIPIEKITSKQAKNQPWHKRKDFADNCFCKLNMWKFTKYEQIVYLDSDMIVIKGIDDLFEVKGFAACPSTSLEMGIINGERKLLNAKIDNEFFNGGLLVLNPNMETYNDLMDKKDKMISTIDPSDQGFFNEYYRGKWHNLGPKYNATRRMYHDYREKWKEIGDDLRVIHFALAKPWIEHKQWDELDELWWKEYRSEWYAEDDAWIEKYSRKKPKLGLKFIPKDSFSAP